MNVELQERAFHVTAFVIDGQFDLVDVLVPGEKEVQTVDRDGLDVASVRVHNGDRVQKHLNGLLSP